MCIEFYLLINSHVLRINHVKKVYARAIVSTIKGVGVKCRWQQVEEEHLSQLGGSGTIRVSNLIFHPTSTTVLFYKYICEKKIYGQEICSMFRKLAGSDVDIIVGRKPIPRDSMLYKGYFKC